MRILTFGICALSISSSSLLQSEEINGKLKAPKEPSSFPLGGDLTLALDCFRSLPDGSWGGNMGAYGALNLAWAVPKLKQQGVGIQAGGSYGVYDWDGRGSVDSMSLQLEGFISVGAFRMTPHNPGFNAGVTYDWMFNQESGVFGLSPNMAQVRGQLGYLFRGGNEFGFLGSYDTSTSHQSYASLPITFRAVSQVNAFWRHIFKNRGETMIWAGTPYRKGLMFESGRTGSYIVGASFKAPLTRTLSVDAHGMYMGARTNTGDNESQNYAANVCVGLTYSFGGRKAGARPYLPVANNSNFIVDTNLSY